MVPFPSTVPSVAERVRLGSLRPPPSVRGGRRIDVRHRQRLLAVVVGLPLLLVLGGCQLGVVAEVVVHPDGSGELAVVFHLDGELVAELDAIGVDPTAELAAAVLDDDDWSLGRADDGDGLVVAIQRDVADPEAVGSALRELTSGLAAADPALLLDLEVTVDDDGRSSVEGTGGFRPPATAGASLDGEPIGAHGDELAAMVERAVAPMLVLTLPGDVVSSNADDVDGRTLRWHLPVGDERLITAEATAPPWWVVHAQLVAIAAAVLAVVVVVAVVWSTMRRRRRRRARAMTSWV